jgi:hypothetical protein
LSLIQDGYEWYLREIGAEDTNSQRKEFEYEEKIEEKLKTFFGDKFEDFRKL